jgi:hypothetical protein
VAVGTHQLALVEFLQYPLFRPTLADGDLADVHLFVPHMVKIHDVVGVGIPAIRAGFLVLQLPDECIELFPTPKDSFGNLTSPFRVSFVPEPGLFREAVFTPSPSSSAFAMEVFYWASFFALGAALGVHTYSVYGRLINTKRVYRMVELMGLEPIAFRLQTGCSSS